MKESGKKCLKCVAYESTRVPTFKLRGSTGLEGSKGSKGGAAHSHMEAPRSFEYTLSLENKKPVNLQNSEPLEPLPLQPQRPLDLMQER